MRAGLFGVLLVEFVELDDLRVETLAAHRRQADPDDRNMGELERRDQSFDALAIEFAPFVAERIERIGAVLEGLQIVDADDDDDKIKLVLGRGEIVGGL